ncbi:uncharacterized protein VTP21DRAFT_10499 [Calcarisporiella thermophila]|uniref:uncharacterized protein n=1 Tax=Calcarisporiella thermophila TaxID=911321 RepID=UPI0037421B50
MSDQDYEALPETAPVYVHLMAGAAAGITEHVVMYPVDFLKTRMQILNPSPAAVYTGISNAFSRITSTEGVTRLWRGVNSVILGAGPAHALYFATYEKCKDVFGGNREGYHPIATSVAGAIASIFHDAFMTPFDVIKQRMQLHGSTHPTIMACARSVYRVEGLRAFYISYPTTLSMSIPFQSIQFTTYEFFRKLLNPENKYDPWVHIVSGGLSGAVAAAATTPLDVVKTLLQTRGQATDPRIQNCSGFWQGAQLVYERNGPRGFFRGLQPRILAHMPSTALSWSVYEAAKYFIRRKEQKEQHLRL